MKRSLLSICLAFVLALTSQVMAVAKGTSAATGQMVICNGSGTAIIYLDAQGQPTSAPHFCPDCAPSMTFVVDAPEANPPQGVYSAFLDWPLHLRPVPVAKRVLPHTRAPPVPV